MSWVTAVPFDRLAGKPFVFRHGPRQIAVVRVEDEVFAIDNRCPHEGYPLAEGSIGPDCVLTCNWHNWKFRLRDGECVIGGDHVRTYPTRIDGGQVCVDVSPPPREVVQRQATRGLQSAFDDRDYGRVCREIARLDYEGLDPLMAVRLALEWCHDRLEFGTTHGMPATVDWLELAALGAGNREHRLICLAEAVDHVAFDGLRRRVHPYAGAGDPFDRDAFETAIEAEDVARAEGLVRRGLDDGLHWEDMEEAFLSAALAHYNDFGHSLIYVFKARQAVERLGRGVEPHLMLPLARGIGYATREDLIPEFRSYTPALGRLPEPRPSGSADANRPPVPFPATMAEAFDWLGERLDRHSVEPVYDALLEALALNLLHFDTHYDTSADGPVSHNVGWLDFTHGVTFANAARRMCERFPAFWKPALAQMACFLGRNVEFLDPHVDRRPWQVDEPDDFFAGVYEHLLDHGLRDPIFAAHHLKTSLAVKDELPTASSSCRSSLLQALNRFLHSPIKAKHVRREARQAISLVGRDYE